MRFTEIAVAKPFEGKPIINLADCVGASPDKEIIIKIPVIGKRPICYSVKNLPKGLALCGSVITGKVSAEGNYEMILVCENELGICEKKLTLEIKRDTVQLTPLMGFTSWNAFAFAVTQEKMEYAAKKMAELGINEYGYNYINIDSGWQGAYGGKYDAIMPNEKFPDMKGFCERMHKMGYKCGIYSTPMLNAFGCSMSYKPLPSGCTQGEPDPRFSDERGGIGVIRKEKNNALQWAEWGFDYLKYDWRPSDPVNAELMRCELVATDRDFGYSVTLKARPEYHTYWEKYCSSYRCSIDSLEAWDNLIEIYRTYFDFIEYQNKGHYYDLDMLDIGTCDLFKERYEYNYRKYGFTEDEMVVVYSVRAFLNSPIQLSTNFENISEFELSIYCNEEVIAINQDSAFKAAIPLLLIEEGDGMLHAFKKKLSGGDYAICVFNFGERVEHPKIYLDEISHVRDVWAKCDIGETSVISLDMQPHTVRMFRIKEV